MPSFDRWLVYRYGGAAIAVVAATACRVALDPLVGARFPLIGFFLAVSFAAWCGGLGPALLAMAMSALAIPYFILAPHGSLAIDDGAAQAGYAAFLVVGLAIALMGGSNRRARRVAEEKAEEASTERRRVEESMRAFARVEERLRVTLESLGEAVISSDAEGNVEYMNPVAVALTGWAIDEARGRPLSNVFLVREESVSDISGHPRSSSAILMARDGSERTIEFVATTIRESDANPAGKVLVFRDVEERRRTEKALRTSERRLVQLADTMPQIVWTAETGGSVDYFNARWYEYTGLSPDESLSDDGWLRAVHPDDTTRLSAARVSALDGGKLLETEIRLRDREGNYRWHLIRSMPIFDEMGRMFRRFGTATDIDDRRRAEVALRASEERFRQLAGALPQLVWVSGPDRSVTYYNDRFYEYTGMDRDAISDPLHWRNYLHPDDVTPVLDAIARADAGDGLFDAEYRMKNRSGVYRWFLGRAVTAYDESGDMLSRFGTATDIEDRRRSESNARFLAEASSMLSNLIDPESTLRQVAQIAVPYFADWCTVDLADEAGVLKRPIVSHLDPEKARFAELLRRHFDTDSDHLSGSYAVMNSGRPIFIEEVSDEDLVRVAHNADHLDLMRKMGLKSCVSVPLKGRSGRLGVLSFAMAESHRRYGPDDLRLAEDLAHRTAIALENARLYEELRANDRRKNEFLATLAHELRNPLAPIRNSLHLLDREEAIPDAGREVLGMMTRQVEHIGRLVDDLLDMSRINQGKVELRKQVVDLATVVDRSLEVSRAAFEDRGHVLTVSLPKEPILIEADPTRLGQVLDNLLNNAAKYTDPGGRVGLSVERSGDLVEIRVRDTGIGIPPAMLPEIFELFVQAERRTDRSQGGLGIGLSLVRRLVEMHGGSVTAHSEGAGLGSEFTVRLPAPLRPSRAPAPDRPVRPAKAEPLLARLRILVVDDNVDSARSMALLLKRSWGQDVEVAYDGPAALEAARTFRPDFILLDIGLPGMSGYEVAQRLREKPEFLDTVIVAMTGWGQEEDRNRSRAAGFDHHLVKPLDPEVLMQILADVQPSA